MSEPEPESFITTLGNNFVSLLVAGMPYLDPTYGGFCRTATEPKSVFDLGDIPSYGILIALGDMVPEAKPKTVGRMSSDATLVWRLYITSASFNRATAPGRTGELGDPGTDKMMADVLATCHGKFIHHGPDARLYPGSFRWWDDTNSKTIYTFNWLHGWVLQEVGTGAWSEP